MKVAISVWMERVSPVFDTSRELLIVEAGDTGPAKQFQEALGERPPHERVDCLQRLGVETLICGAISRPLADLITSAGIHLVPFIAGDVREVLDAFMRGHLAGPAFAMPGCCAQGRRRAGARCTNQGGLDMFGGRGGGRGGGMGRGGAMGGGGRDAGQRANLTLGRGQGRGRCAALSSQEAEGEKCVCRECGFTQPKEPGVPCSTVTCPKCGGAMTWEQHHEHR